MTPLVELIERRVGDCGCPEEEYLFNGLNLIVHFEPTGEADGFLDGGDWGEETYTTAQYADPDIAREEVFAWAASMTEGPEL